MEIPMQTDAKTIHDSVRDAYGKAATDVSSPSAASCSAANGTTDPARNIGYSAKELKMIPDEANLGLGCGNPTAIARLGPGETVLDLGSGAGMDAFAAAAQVGPTGRVIGVDTTPEMLARARRIAVERGLADRVEFREGLIEDLPVTDDSVDVVLSNCVINLSPDKAGVFTEAFRVLKPGGRLAVSDIVLTEPLPAEVAGTVGAWVGCVGGATPAEDYLGAIEEAGFTDVSWTRTPAAYLLAGVVNDPAVAAVAELLGPERVQRIAESVWSYKIQARKPLV
jgi:SAM-dependent methyltransferase